MWGRKRKLDNAAPLAVTPPTPTHVVYDNRVPWPMIILSLAAITPLLCVVAWWAGVFMMDRAGYDRPEQALASAIVGGVGAVAVLAVVVLLAYGISQAVLSRVLAHREAMKRLEIDLQERLAEAQRYRQLTAMAPVPSGRVMSEDQRFCKILEAVMFNVYDHLARSGEFTGVFRPWSRRGVMAVQLSDGSNPTDREASQVRLWLESRGVVENGQVAVGKYPDLGSFQELLYREYDRPITVAGTALPVRANQGYQHI